jgi:hypothetical protein
VAEFILLLPAVSSAVFPSLLCSGRAGSGYQWWILLLSSFVAIGSFIAW